MKDTTLQDPILEIRQLTSVLRRRGSPESHWLDIKEFSVARGSFVAIRGKSGDGKTHCLTNLAIVREPTSLCAFVIHAVDRQNGTIQTYDICELWKGRRSCGFAPLKEERPRGMFRRAVQGRVREIERLRGRHFGFAMQHGELLPALTMYENIEMPLRINGVSARNARAAVRRVLDQLEIGQDVANRRVCDVSGGQQQRVALARAIIHQPQLVFVDEPTGQLDQETAEAAIRLLAELQDQRTTIIMVTHDKVLAEKFATHIVTLEAEEVDDVTKVARIKEFKSNTPERKVRVQ